METVTDSDTPRQEESPPEPSPDVVAEQKRQQLAQRITYAMKRRGFCYESLASRAHISMSTMRSVGVHGNPTRPNTVAHIADALGLERDDLTNRSMMGLKDLLDTLEENSTDALARTLAEAIPPRFWDTRRGAMVIGAVIVSGANILVAVIAAVVWRLMQ